MFKKLLLCLSLFSVLHAQGQWWQQATNTEMGLFAFSAYTSFLAHAYSDDYVEPTIGSAALSGGAYYGVRMMLEQQGLHLNSERGLAGSVALGFGVGSVLGKGYRYGSRGLHYLAGVLYGRIMGSSSHEDQDEEN